MAPFDADALEAHRRLVARLCAGDTDAMRLLYLELSPIVHGVVRRTLEDPEDAREAVQDTFIKVWRQASRYRADRGEVVSWVVFIARNAAIDRVRQGARRRQLLEQWTPTDDATTSPASTASEQTDLLDTHLARLSAPQRRALQLAFFAGCTQTEISSTMKIPVGNVKNHLRRGLSKLRQWVASHE
ncbi:RNA polymerase sigma factor [Synoicihabitans lomoniglobus]|uniref:Sigma-70 family RNA polymerase sigma factor n=1 Tax=Synoicihabitans lomoniglobus TaxID=2909285 RepID=A0AAE9ZR24_9BACT|nr:sigma-70 family RNA polymerase sigma factor [Opitutaceae bacterium LMO-M01]WED63630.1 sigma-70 family RNA polymerase sigma factor [Opitutaceae bacterium LMO-M01]